VLIYVIYNPIALALSVCCSPDLVADGYSLYTTHRRREKFQVMGTRITSTGDFIGKATPTRTQATAKGAWSARP
jgi:hypothetical protein